LEAKFDGEPKIPSEHREQLRNHYQSSLLDDVTPWWLAHSLDREYGGYFTRLERTGARYADDKDIWMTGREIWMFSHLYNTYDSRSEWLEAARLGVDFLLKHAFKPDGRMYFRLKRDGRPLSEVLSKYTEVFAAIGLAEYSKAADNQTTWAKAMEMYERLMLQLGRAEDTVLLGYPLKEQFHLHADDMCRITVAWVLNQLAPDQRFEDSLTESAESIMTRHWKPEMRALLENVAMDGSPMLEYQEGRMFHPGHSIESAWMLMELALHRKDQALFETAVDIMLASLKQGWDKEYGGILYLTNIDWTPVHTIEANCKLWWPHSEALYALLLAWSVTGRQDIAAWYEKLHDYSFQAFPDLEYGEWFGYLNRDGSPIWTAKANGWKGFFHLPRALYRCYRLLDGRLRF